MAAHTLQIDCHILHRRHRSHQILQPSILSLLSLKWAVQILLSSGVSLRTTTWLRFTEEPKQNFRTYVHTISISLQTSSKESASSSMMFAAAALRRVVPRAAARRSMSTKNRADLLAGAG